jgi:hypothetical protein
MHETGATLNPFSQANKLAVLNTDPIVRLTGANLPAPVSSPLLGGSCPHAAQHTCPSKSFNLNIFVNNLVNFKATKVAHPISEFFK